MENRIIKFKNLPVSISVAGDGIPVVFLHGYLESSEIWLPFVYGLLESGKIILIDLPGHGKTGIFGEIHTMNFMADVVKYILDSLAIEKCIMIGHSMGGYVTLSFAGKYPDRLHAFTLFHSHPFADTEETRKNRAREISLVEEGKKELIYNTNIPRAFASDSLNKFKSQIQSAKQIARETSEKGIINALRGMMKRQDNLKLVLSPPVPFIWILGMKDNYIDFETLMERMGNINMENVNVLEDSGHMGFIEEEEHSLGIIIDFINRNPLK